MGQKVKRRVVFTEVTGVRLENGECVEVKECILGKKNLQQAQKVLRKQDDSISLSSAKVREQQMQMELEDFIMKAEPVQEEE